MSRVWCEYERVRFNEIPSISKFESFSFARIVVLPHSHLLFTSLYVFLPIFFSQFKVYLVGVRALSYHQQQHAREH